MMTQQGDTFDLIAWRELGDVRHVEALIDANRKYVTTQVFEANVELELPKVIFQRFLQDSDAFRRRVKKKASESVYILPEKSSRRRADISGLNQNPVTGQSF